MILNNTEESNGKLERMVQEKLTGLEGISIARNDYVNDVSDQDKGKGNCDDNDNDNGKETGAIPTPFPIPNIVSNIRIILYQFRHLLLHGSGDADWFDILIHTTATGQKEQKGACGGYTLAKWRSNSCSCSSNGTEDTSALELGPYVTYATMDTILCETTDTTEVLAAEAPTMGIHTEYSLYRVIQPTYQLLVDYLQTSQKTGPSSNSNPNPNANANSKVIQSVIEDYCSIPSDSMWHNHDGSKQEYLVFSKLYTIAYIIHNEYNLYN